jgi:metal-sulfur cluster biosynthetic enzyme
VKITTELLDRPDVLASEAGEGNLRALQALYDVVDPELGINIVDLGLVYNLDVDGGLVRVEMTMTTPACPLHDYLTEHVEQAIRGDMPDVRTVAVHLVWDPPWGPERMSRVARQELGWPD